jgi:transposase
MSYTRLKTSKSGKIYAYEVTSFWDPDKRQARSKSTYLGIVDGDNNIIPKGTIKAKRLKQITQEKLILDFGNGYLILEFIKKSLIFNPIKFVFDAFPEIISLICYRLCNPGPMYNCNLWLSGNIISKIRKNDDLSSQNISRILRYIGSESIQRPFFREYVKLIGGSKKNVIIDASSLPNHISSNFNAWGYGDGGIEKQFRFLCVLDQISKMPLFYRLLPGNIADVSTLETTISELIKLGIKNSFVLLDAGYFSESNITELREKKIDFLMRIPSSREIYKNIIRKKIKGLESLENAVTIDTRSLFVKSIKSTFYNKSGYIYVIMDPNKRAKDLNKLIKDRQEDNAPKKQDPSMDKYSLARAGIFMLASSKKIPANEVLSAYYMRMSIEQVFGFSKEDLEILPIRCHSDDTIRGYLFLQFLLLILFVEIRKCLNNEYTVEQAEMITRNLKCKVFDKDIIVSEQNKDQKNIFKLCSILVPTNLGI